MILGSTRLLGLAIAALWTTAAAAAWGEPVPAALRDRALTQGSVRVIVTLAPSPTPAREIRKPQMREPYRRAIERAQGDLRERLRPVGALRERAFEDLPLLAFDASPEVLDALGDAPGVLAIEEDRRLAPLVDSSVPHVGAADAADAGFDGSGWAIAVLDTGVDASHPFLAGKVVAEACFSADGDCPNGQTSQVGPGAGAPCDYATGCVHGTHVAGIAAGDDVARKGVAPGADLVAVQVFSRADGAACDGAGEDPCPLAYTSDVIAGLEHVAALEASLPIAAANVSLGGGLYSTPLECDGQNAAIKLAIDALRALGVGTAAASGNDGSSSGMSAPGCVSSAIGVGATDLGDAIWAGSNSHAMLDLLAPGVFILSAAPPSIFPSGWVTATGTSMATPHVAGSLALARQADPSASVDTLVGALQDGGVAVTDFRNGVTTARIAADESLRLLAPAQCYDGLDNDGDLTIDFPDDPGCSSGWDDGELSGCGLGFELVLLAPLLGRLRRRASGSARPTREGIRR